MTADDARPAVELHVTPRVAYGDAFVLAQRRAAHYAVCPRCHGVAFWLEGMGERGRLMDLTGSTFWGVTRLECGSCGQLVKPPIAAYPTPGWQP